MNPQQKKTGLAFLVVVVVVAMSLFVGGLALHFYRELRTLRSQTPSPLAENKAADMYVCPMHLQIQSPQPGSCPICGMDLVKSHRKHAAEEPHKPEDAKKADAADKELVIHPGQQTLLGMKTVVVSRVMLGGAFRTTGRIAYDETRVHHIHVKTEAFVEHLHANFVGKLVKKGERLASLYSPDLYAAQKEYVIALEATKGSAAATMGVSLANAAKEKLLLWGVSEKDLAQLERTGQASRTYDLYAPISGYVIGKTAVHGMRVRPEDALFDLADLSRMWVLAEVYESELPRLRNGQRAKVSLSYWPGRTWLGQVNYIFPSVDPKTRTVRVRIEVENQNQDLRADMFADVEIAQEQRRVLAIPSDAVIETGKRKIVFVKQEEGKFAQRSIVTGEHSGGFDEVLLGLTEGEHVAVGASFLLDSEARLQGAP